ncbi:MAG: hypothetical protein PHP98_04440 [Kiritimatiellae bacterium]|nr:hypothetical protein [Kiritimatiellia bacterium]
MGNTDFIDDDLIQRRDQVKEVKMGPGRDVPAASAIPNTEAVPAEELNLTPLAKRKEEINSKMATKLDELERLRARQNALEQEKTALEHLRSGQEKYEAGKREMIDNLEKSLVLMEREDVVLNQRLALLTDTAGHFKEMLKELRGFNEERWPTDSAGLRDELNRTLTIIDNVRKEYNLSCARLEAAKEAGNQDALSSQLLLEESLAAAKRPRSFGDWFKVGFAVSLPLIIMLAALMAVLLMERI